MVELLGETLLRLLLRLELYIDLLRVAFPSLGRI